MSRNQLKPKKSRQAVSLIIEEIVWRTLRVNHTQYFCVIEILPVTSQQVKAHPSSVLMLYKQLHQESFAKSIPDCLLLFKSKLQELTLEGGCLVGKSEWFFLPSYSQVSYMTSPSGKYKCVWNEVNCWWAKCGGQDWIKQSKSWSCPAWAANLNCQSVKCIHPPAPMHTWA